jgi:glyoxylase I family protein
VSPHPLEIRQLDHVVLRVRDLARSLAFWVDALGCSEERRLEQLGLVQLRAGASLIDLVPVDGPLGRAGGAPPGKDGRNVDHVALRIARLDLPALRAHLGRHGIEVPDPDRRYGAEGYALSVYLRDPDDNVLELRGEPLPEPG